MVIRRDANIYAWGSVSTTRIELTVSDPHEMSALVGSADVHLRRIEAAFADTDVQVRGNVIRIEGAEADTVAELFRSLIDLLDAGQDLDPSKVARSIDLVRDGDEPFEVFSTDVLHAPGGRVVHPKSAGQKRYVDAIANNIITFGIGPAGTGKSWLAVACAVQALNAKLVDRIVLCRPAVEAGERLGFLPGDLMAKVDPYLRPLYDALADFLEPEGLARLMERDAVEVAPLAFMRGRTLNRSFIILDEAQNTTSEQMKMFLTRIGFSSRAVVTGDATQVDVTGQRSGLAGLEPVLGGIEGIEFVHLSSRDVVRHRIVQDIVDAYAKAEVAKR